RLIRGGTRNIRKQKPRRRKSRNANAAKKPATRTTTFLSDQLAAMADLIRLITATDPSLRNQSLDAACANLSLDELAEQCSALDAFRRRSENLYERVRALFFLYAIHRFHLPKRLNHTPRSTLHAPHSL